MPWSVGVGNRLDVKLTMLRASTLSFRGTWEWKTIASPVSVIYLCCALHDHFVKEYMDKTFDDEFHIDVNDPKIDGLFKPIKCHPPPWPDDGISESDNWVVEKSGPRPRKYQWSLPRSSTDLPIVANWSQVVLNSRENSTTLREFFFICCRSSFRRSSWD